MRAITRATRLELIKPAYLIVLLCVTVRPQARRRAFVRPLQGKPALWPSQWLVSVKNQTIKSKVPNFALADEATVGGTVGRSALCEASPKAEEAAVGRAVFAGGSRSRRPLRRTRTFVKAQTIIVSRLWPLGSGTMICLWRTSRMP